MPYTLAVISDIHANIVALDAVFEDINQQFSEIIEVLCPGDLVGYGPNPHEVLERILAEKKITAVTKGNHDHGVGLTRDPAHFASYIDKFNKYAQMAISFQVSMLDDEEKTFLYQLPTSRTCLYDPFDIKISIIHGSPEYPLDEYILPNTPHQKDLFPFMEMFGIGILLLGHTHIPFIDKSFSQDMGFELLMCNPGSVGQPRDKDSRASYAVIDLESMTAEIIRVDYDIDETCKRQAAAGFPEYLSDRLQKGI